MTAAAPQDSELKELWKKVLTRLQPTIGKNHFITWFNKSCILNANAAVYKIGFPSTYAYNWVRDKYHIKILQALQEIDSQIKEIEYEVDGGLMNPDDIRGIDIKEFLFGAEKRSRQILVNQDKTECLCARTLNHKYPLNNFIAGKDNRLVHSACMAIANNPGGIYNPLYIYGGVGLGKTHLLHGTGLEILKNFPDKNVIYVTSEQFVNDIVGAIRNQKVTSLKEKYRKADCLIVDDVQFFGKKEASQMEFFHTINDLYESNKQILLTSDRPPAELDDLDNRLKSRFAMGMVVEVLPSDFETRMAILQNRCAELGLVVSNDVLEPIAQYIETNIRELLGALNQLIGQVQFNNIQPTAQLSLRIVQKFYSRDLMIKTAHIPTQNVYQGVSAVPTQTLSPDRIIQAVSEFYKMKPEDLTGDCRKKEIVVPRQICMYLMRILLDQSFARIGEGFSNRNHTTAMHACEKIENEIKTNYRVARDLNSIKIALGV
ncbi:chromosomal replication initiator protein DnaA [Candidatus Peregrinibacteria bacterium]|nr:chromosomal replication initiator protein DnaA [Candidatus Peregrinibacteria bacterium]